MTQPDPPRRESPPWQPGTRLIAGTLLLLLGAVLLYQLRRLLVPVSLALLLAYILHPLVNLTSRRLHWPRARSVLLIYLSLILLIAGATTGIGFAVSQQLGGLIEDLIELSNEIPRQLEQLASQVIRIGPLMIDLGQANLEPIIGAIAGAIRPLLSQTGALLGSLASATASIVGLALGVMVFGYYFLLDFEKLEINTLSICPVRYRSDFARLLKETARAWQSFLRGQLILGFIIGSVVAVLLSILGVRFSLVLGLIAGLMEFVPIFGPFIAGAIAILVAFFQGANWWGLSPGLFSLIILMIFVIIQQIENNVLVPRIIGSSLNLKPLAVLMAAAAGGILAGVLGILLAAPAMATLRIWMGYVYCKSVGLDPWTESRMAADDTRRPGRAARWLHRKRWPWSRPAAVPEEPSEEGI